MVIFDISTGLDQIQLVSLCWQMQDVLGFMPVIMFGFPSMVFGGCCVSTSRTSLQESGVADGSWSNMLFSFRTRLKRKRGGKSTQNRISANLDEPTLSRAEPHDFCFRSKGSLHGWQVCCRSQFFFNLAMYVTVFCIFLSFPLLFFSLCVRVYVHLSVLT